MSKETPPPDAFQIDLFSGELVDTRADSQKRKDAERILPRQPFLFSQREIAQFGVNAKPLLPITEHTRLELENYDPRTEEEKARDTELQAQKRTLQLFPPEASSTPFPRLLTAGATVLLPAQCATTLAEKAREQQRVVFERRLAQQFAGRQRIWEWLHQRV